MKSSLRILVFAAAIYRAYAVCNTCSVITGLACVANDQFKVCVNGLPSTTLPANQCPTGTLCTEAAQVCSPQATVQPPCNRCNTCDTSKMFACTGYNTFALCYGTTSPSTTIMSCPGTTVCNIDSPQICVDPVATGLGGTCPSVPTLPDPAADPQRYCQIVRSSGRFEITTDPNCQQYVLCALSNNAWIGNIYRCPGTTRFNASTRLCGAAIPARCA